MCLIDADPVPFLQGRLSPALWLVMEAGYRIIEVVNILSLTVEAGFNFDEIEDGFKNPAPPKPNCAEEVNTSNAG